jgi:hypothetical protein
MKPDTHFDIATACPELKLGSIATRYPLPVTRYPPPATRHSLPRRQAKLRFAPASSSPSRMCLSSCAGGN